MRYVMRAVLTCAALLCAAAPASAQQGKAVFEGKGNCWTCHGRDGRGTPLGPDLTDGAWLHGDGSADSVRAVVRAGVERPKRYPGVMPPMGGARLSAAEVDAVVAYVRSLRRSDEPAAAAVQPVSRSVAPGSALPVPAGRAHARRWRGGSARRGAPSARGAGGCGSCPGRCAPPVA